MAPPIEIPSKSPAVQKASRAPLPLNERILSSMTRKTAAAHPWHELEIGTYLDYLPYLPLLSWPCYAYSFFPLLPM